MWKTRHIIELVCMGDKFEKKGSKGLGGDVATLVMGVILEFYAQESIITVL